MKGCRDDLEKGGGKREKVRPSAERESWDPDAGFRCPATTDPLTTDPLTCCLLIVA